MALQRRNKAQVKREQAALFQLRVAQARQFWHGKPISLVDLLDKKRKYGTISAIADDGEVSVVYEWFPGSFGETGFPVDHITEMISLCDLAFVDDTPTDLGPPYCFKITFFDSDDGASKSVFVYGNVKNDAVADFLTLMTKKGNEPTIETILLVS